jgi:signal transduction histidine kinase/ActR/RegA family two-component response regulator
VTASTRKVGLRRRLFMLAVVGILPLAALAGIGLFALIQQQRTQAERVGLDVARALATAVDAELRRAQSVLETLAATPQLDAGDIEGFNAIAQSVVRIGGQWRAIFVSDTAGKLVLNAGDPDVDAEMRIAQSEAIARVIRARTPVIGAIYGDVRRKFGVNVHVPVVRDGELKYVLTGVMRPETILAVVNQQHVPDNWVVSVFDANGMRVARSRSNDDYIGMPAAPSLSKLMSSGAREGVGFSYALEGDFVHTAYTRLPSSRWVVAIGISPTAMTQSAYGSLLAYGGGIVLSIALGLIAALAVARSITKPMATLRLAAQSFGRGEPPLVPVTSIQEIHEVADALVASADERTRGEAERESLLVAERNARAAAELARRRLELLSAASATFSRSLDQQATLQAIGAIVVPTIADWCRVDLVDANGVLQRALAHHSDPEKSRYGMELVRRLRASRETPGSMQWATATGQSHLAHFDPPDAFDAIRDRDLLTFSNAIGMRAYYVVPLIARGRTLGALAALQAESGRHFTPDDCALINEVAQRAALAIDNARLFADAEAAYREAERANRSKDEFLAMLGHELRNPLAPIVTALHLMALRDAPESSSERKIIERQVAHLSRLVDDLLDVSRITQGKIQLQREHTDLRAVVERAIELTLPLFEKREHPVEVALPEAPAPVWADVVRLTQVFCNLLTNAAKFTPPDGRVRLRLVASGDWAEAVVEDTGKGIEPALLPKIFDLFVQGEQPLDRNVGGLGLGLAIVKTLVQMHGGSVGVTSEGEGRGSAFSVRLPLAMGAQQSAPTSTPSADLRMRGRGRILIVDDNADAAETLALMLETCGYEVRTAGDGAAALAMLDSFVPALAILDIGLPGMDGYELARRLRADARLAGLRLIALTGYGREPDRTRALANDFQEHLVKPVRPDRLLDAVSQLLDPESRVQA